MRKIKVFIQNEAGSLVKHFHNEKTLELLGSVKPVISVGGVTLTARNNPVPVIKYDYNSHNFVRTVNPASGAKPGNTTFVGGINHGNHNSPVVSGRTEVVGSVSSHGAVRSGYSGASGSGGGYSGGHSSGGSSGGGSRGSGSSGGGGFSGGHTGGSSGGGSGGSSGGGGHSGGGGGGGAVGGGGGGGAGGGGGRGH